MSKEEQRRSFDDTVAAAKEALISYESALGQQLAAWQYENVIANSERYLPGIAEMELAEQQQHLSFTIPFLMDAEQSSLQFSAKQRAIQQALGGTIYRSAFSGAASLDDLNSYLGRPVGLHEFNEYVQGTTNNAAWVASFGASDSLYITDTSKYTGWAWNGQRIAFTFARDG